MTARTFEIAQTLVYWLPAIVVAVVVHEWAHGYAAHLLGDPTPASRGRLTLNPLAHIDWMWSVILPAAMLITSLATTGQPLVFGGAKPVPVDPSRMRGSPRLAWVIVAAAGPVSNLLLALVAALLLRLILQSPTEGAIPLALAVGAMAMVRMNILLAVFNLLPIPPLDGGRILTALLPNPLDRLVGSLERFGLVLVVLLALGGMLGQLIGPLITGLEQWYFQLAGLSTRLR